MTALAGGWEPLPSEVWHEIAEHLAKPWTPGQAAHDLRVYAAGVRLKRRNRMPGRVSLSKRWGWTDRQVRGLLRDESRWVDPSFVSVERTTPVPPPYQPRTTPPVETQVEPAPVYQPRTTPVPPVSIRAEVHRSQEHNSPSLQNEHEIEPVSDLTVNEGDLSWTAATTRQAFEAVWKTSRPQTRYAAARQENDRATELAKLLTTAGWSSDQLAWRIADYLTAHAAGQAFPKPNAEGPQRTGLPQFLAVVRRELTPAPRLVADTPKPHSTGRHIIPTALDLADIAAAEEWLRRQDLRKKGVTG